MKDGGVARDVEIVFAVPQIVLINTEHYYIDDREIERKNAIIMTI